MNISVYLADDNVLIREGVKTLISMEDDLDSFGRVRRGHSDVGENHARLVLLH